MNCSSVNRFFTSNLLQVGDWTPNRCATQNRGDVDVACAAGASYSFKSVGFGAQAETSLNGTAIKVSTLFGG
jgi:hypothetical protein